MDTSGHELLEETSGQPGFWSFEKGCAVGLGSERVQVCFSPPLDCYLPQACEPARLRCNLCSMSDRKEKREMGMVHSLGHGLLWLSPSARGRGQFADSSGSHRISGLHLACRRKGSQVRCGLFPWQLGAPGCPSLDIMTHGEADVCWNRQA